MLRNFLKKSIKRNCSTSSDQKKMVLLPFESPRHDASNDIKIMTIGSIEKVTSANYLMTNS